MGKTFKQKIDEAKNKGIKISDGLLECENSVGVYGFFATKENKEEICFYIGKSTNIVSRLLGSSGGHVYMYLNNDYSKVVPQKIKEYIDKHWGVEVRILDEIDYHDKSFSKAAHRLALAELHRIVQYQELNQCENQVPEGFGPNGIKFWEKNYKVTERK
ncbi:MAG: hypothetical protein ACTH8E_02885 [Brochothrix thermosphacta]|uniref:hypothetical protein n=1 Tax=Brochothrix thermosphacta TaxID=2756 RepID=UPI003F8EF5B5